MIGCCEVCLIDDNSVWGYYNNRPPVLRALQQVPYRVQQAGLHRTIGIPLASQWLGTARDPIDGMEGWS